MSDAMPFRRFGTMLDCSRNAVMNLPTLKRWIDILADLGYNTLLLYTEDTYEVDNQPYFGYLRGRYSQQELREIDAYAADKGVEVIPCIQTLAHLNSIFRWSTYADIRDCNDILLAGDDRTYALIEDMFASIAKTYRSKNVNIGMDEAHMLGRGKYLDKNGLIDRSEILVDHLGKVAAIADKYGLKLTMWGDMFFRMISGGEYYVDNFEVSDEVKQKVPANVDLIYWDYYSTDYDRYNRQMQAHNAIKNGIWFAGGLWSWNGFAPQNDYSMRATRAALTACRDNGVKDVFLTMWGDNGAECSKFSLLPALYYAAQIAAGNTDMAAIRTGFEKKFGVPFDAYLLADLPGTPNTETGEPLDPEKYMLYNDCFLGRFDDTARPGDAAAYAACAEKLAVPEKNPAYGYVFRTLRTLCEVLAVKYDIGVKTRAAYGSGDRTQVAALLPTYDLLLQRIEAFYAAFSAQWMQENKPHGFDVQDLRIGGLLLRIRHCRERLQQYVNGDIDRIEELEETILPHRGDGVPSAAPQSYNSWIGAATANVIG